jgi:ATP-dependent protease ClpP protease subunit
MQNSAARVIVRASGGVHSAGSMILLAADEFTLSPNFNCLVHNGSFGAVGKTSDVKAQTAFQGSFMDKLMRQTYEGFLEPAEIDALIAGKDFWFDSDSFMERIHKREKYFGRTVDTDEE